MKTAQTNTSIFKDTIRVWLVMKPLQGCRYC